MLKKLLLPMLHSSRDLDSDYDYILKNVSMKELISNTLTYIADVLDECVKARRQQGHRPKPQCEPVVQSAEELKSSVMSLLDLVYYERPFQLIIPELAGSVGGICTEIDNCAQTSLTKFFGCRCQRSDRLLRKWKIQIEWLAYVLRRAYGKDQPEPEEGKYPLMNTSVPPSLAEYNAAAWFYIASLYGRSKVYVAKDLIELIRSRDMILYEGGADALLEMVSSSNSESKIAGATALISLAGDDDRARYICHVGTVSVIKQILESSSTRDLKLKVAELVTVLAEFNPDVKEVFAAEGVTYSLIKMMSDTRPTRPKKNVTKSSSSGSLLDSSYDMDNLRLATRAAAAEALSVLVEGSSINCVRAAETKCLLKLAEGMAEESLQFRLACAEAFVNICVYAAEHKDFRDEVFGPNNKEAADQIITLIVKLIDPSSDDVNVIRSRSLQAIGLLCQLFTSKSKFFVTKKVAKHIGHEDPDIRSEAIIALTRFTDENNNLRSYHIKKILECGVAYKVAAAISIAKKEKLVEAVTLLCRLILFGKRSDLKMLDIMSSKEALEKVNLGDNADPQLTEMVSKTVALLSSWVRANRK